jgi:hypothetical protein
MLIVAVPPGYTTEPTMRLGLTSHISAAAAKSLTPPTEMKDLVNAGYILIGSPSQVTEQIIELAGNCTSAT